MRSILKTLAVVAAITVCSANTGCQPLDKLLPGAETTAPATPQEIQTLAQATNAATLVTRAAAVYVRAGNLSDAQLNQLGALNDGVQEALHKWHAAADKGNSVYAASFNAALSAFNKYRASLPPTK